MKRKQILSMMICAALAASLAGCATTSTSPAPTASVEETAKSQPETGMSYKPGTYQSTVKGHNGDVTVEVTVEEQRIAEVKVLEHKETENIAGPAINGIPEEIVKYQSLGIDGVTGATVTSNAILEGVGTAIAEAGGDITALKAVKVVKEVGENITKEADVVVIGAGGAGLTAAIEAKDNGAESVILLEKLSAIGGTTFTSQGVIAGYNTKISEKLGVTLSYEEMYANLMNNANYRLDPDLTKITVEKSGETIDWLEERVGLPFMEEIRVGYGPLQMMHVMDGAGPAMDKAFKTSLDSAGVELMLETRAVEILMDTEGNTAGVRAEKDGAEVLIHAKSVIIATGGYANNPELTKLLDPEKEGTFGIGFPGATGDGIIMANNVGAALTHTNHLMAVLKDYEIMSKHNGTSASANISKFIASENLALVGADGLRFVDEKSGGFMNQELNGPIFDKMHKDGIGYVWAVSDKATIDKMEVKRGMDMQFIEAENTDALAELMKVDAEGLRQSLEHVQGPYYAVAVVPCEIITYGGVARNANAEVLRADETVIPGLYVAGEAGANSAYMGFTLSNCFTWGRIAGANAAKFSK